MVFDKVWKRIRRPEIFISLLASILIIIDILTDKIGFAVPVFKFFLKVLNQRIPVFIVIAFAFAVVALSLWRLNKRIKNMKTISHRRELIFANNAYWVMSLGLVAPQGPFCPKCYPEGKEVRMINTYAGINEVKCPVCGLTTISSVPSISQQIFGR